MFWRSGVLSWDNINFDNPLMRCFFLFLPSFNEYNGVKGHSMMITRRNVLIPTSIGSGIQEK